MSGHSKWASIKHEKSKNDAKRGQLFTKIIREITVAAKMGGGDPEKNPRLRAAISAAKNANMPRENIERAIKKGTGEIPGTTYEEVRYEGYGPSGVAIIVETLTDNKNRTVAELRHIFSRFNGNLGETGCVGWMFDWKGVITIPRENYPDEDYILQVALDAGADDVKVEENIYQVITSQSDLEHVRARFDEAGIKYESAQVQAMPQSTVKVEGKKAETLLKLLEALDDHDDVKNVYSNFEMDDALLETLKNQ
ncbi:MAG: YebC/PmpR family DNA-binding transcriptional regulator [bacterium]